MIHILYFNLSGISPLVWEEIKKCSSIKERQSERDREEERKKDSFCSHSNIHSGLLERQLDSRIAI